LVVKRRGKGEKKERSLPKKREKKKGIARNLGIPTTGQNSRGKEK